MTLVAGSISRPAILCSSSCHQVFPAMDLDDRPQEVLVPPSLSILIEDSGQQLHPKGYSIMVGRARGSTLQIKDSSVSERHAVISWTGHHWQLRDIGSSNGTKLNAVPLKPQEDAMQLRHGDTLQLGDVTCTVQCEPCEASEVTVEQLLQSQFEAMVQTLLAQQQDDIQDLRHVWATARAELEATVTRRAEGPCA